MSLQLILEVLTIGAAGVFTGAAIYINVVEHPARMECGPSLAVTEFAPSYKRAAKMQATLAIVGFICALATWLLGANVWWLIGGLILVAVVPFTLLVIFPTNKQLLDPALDKNSHLAFQLLQRWGRLHAVRSLLSFVSFVVLLLAR